MAVDLEKHSEPKPIENKMPIYSHPAHEPVRRSNVPETEEILNDLDEKVHNVLAKYEGRVIGPHDAEGIKLEMHRESQLIGSVGVSVVEEVCSVAVQVLLRGVESWIHAEVPAKAMNDEVVNTTQDVDDGGQPKPALMRGGKSTTGIKGSAPYAEPPEHKEGE